MNYSILDELIKLTKKGNASKEKKQAYLSELSTLLFEEGYSQKAEEYLMEGFSFYASIPIISYMKDKSSEEKYEIFNKVIKGTRFRRNVRGISFKLSVSLLCQIINNYPEEKEIIEILIRDIPNKSKNKEGKLSGDAPKVLEKYFVSDLWDNADLPDFSSLTLKSISSMEFCKLFSSILKEVDSVKGVNSEKTDKIKKWVTIIPSPVKVNTKNETDVVSNESSADANSVNQSNANKPFSSKELLDYAEVMKITELRLAATASHIVSIEKETNTLKKKLTNSSGEVESLKKEIEKLTEKLAEKNSQYELLATEKSKINYDLSSVRHELKEKETLISKLSAEIEKQNSVLSVFKTDKESAQSEQLNAIASRLKAEYMDYKDAIDMDMTVDLGENLRQQIQSIFKILAKNGIDVERR